MSEGSVTATGARELRKALKAAGDDMSDLRDANEEVSWLVLRAADRLVPRRSGALAYTGRTSRAVGKASVMYGSARVPYAGVIHYGWSAHGIKANPWVEDAAEQSRPAWIAAYEQAIQEIIAKIEAST